MPAYSFQRRFVPLIESGEKSSTIRNPRKHRTKVGDTLYLYAGQRTKSCRFIGRAICEKIECIWIFPDAKKCEIDGNGHHYWLTDEQVEALAVQDGFENANDFYAWFDETHKGSHIFDLIKWRSLILIGGNHGN